MDQEVKNALLQYEEYKIQAKDLEEKMDVLKVIILPALVVKTDYPAYNGTFVLMPSKTWKFSPAVDTMKKSLDQLKEKEKQMGIAVIDGSPYLQYNPNKGE